MKYCPQCRVGKPKAEFYRNKARPDGLSSQCRCCCRLNTKQAWASDPEKSRERMAKYRKAFLERNPGYEAGRLSHKRAYRAANKGAVSAYFSAYRAGNKPKGAASRARRRAAELKATPKWAHQRYISMFYEIAKAEAKRIGQHVHVDHIVPLRSKTVCGLHCEHNLQLLTAAENLSKGNRTWPDKPGI